MNVYNLYLKKNNIYNDFIIFIKKRIEINANNLVYYFDCLNDWENEKNKDKIKLKIKNVENENYEIDEILKNL